MEKFKKFTDDATGVNPFVPYRKKNSFRDLTTLQKFVLKPLRALISPVPFLIKFLLICIFLIPYFAVQHVSMIIPIGFIKRLLHRYASILCCGCALFTLLGFSGVKSKQVDLEGKDKKTVPSDIAHGDLIVSNYVSYIDFFYLNFKYSPVFAMAVKSKIENGEVIYGLKPFGFFGALYHTLFGQFSESTDNLHKDCQPLHEIVRDAKKYSRGPVVVFPEAVTSNGRGVLKFHNYFFDDMEQVLREDKNFQVVIIGFKYTYEEFSPAYHLGNFWQHIYGTLAQVYNTLNVAEIYLGEEDRKSLEQNFTLSAIRKLVLPKVLGIVSVNSSVSERQKFLKEWNSMNSHEKQE
ncbi:predicted protein [Naegleria gruberi]|uniref:Predicted protein n=1 Tax=Naegleria gruberi TaxID=5762 RepID=D2VQD9_NAEGR|nr:uncharacterized protein NAEGRDRAFT_71190 [Naegleria gruberi]EFC40929.1 predicted protein [Naegleria gruberi]|eukprot:XP_002673673.1 predicted protein [Naegleria gruberi strain NEG-M]